MIGRHFPASLVRIDLAIDPSSPFGVGQGQTLRSDNVDAVFSAKCFDVPDPVVPITHSSQN
jgi:hypothetical protein